MSGQELTVRPEGAMYDLVAAEHVARTMAILKNELNDDDPINPTIATLPSQSQRDRLNHRRQDLRSLLAPASGSVAAVERIGKAVGNTIGGWLNLRGLDGPEVISGFTAKLQELPAWAVIAACKDFQEGRATFEEGGKMRTCSSEYAPSQATIWRVAREKLNDLYAEQGTIERILRAKLAAPVIPDGDRERVRALMEGLASNMGARAREDKRRDAEAAMRASAEAAQRRARFKADADARRLQRYAEMRLRPVYQGTVLCDPEALPASHRFAVDEPIPENAESILEAR